MKGKIAKVKWGTPVSECLRRFSENSLDNAINDLFNYEIIMKLLITIRWQK